MPVLDLGVVRPVIKGVFDPLLDYEVLNIVSHEAAWYIAKVPVPASLAQIPAIGSTVWDRISPDTLSMAEGDARYTLKTELTSAINALVDASPAALDTLNELAAALGDDANFAATMTNALALKAPLASPALTGIPTAPTASVGDNSTTVATTAFVLENSSSGAWVLKWTGSATTVDNLLFGGVGIYSVDVGVAKALIGISELGSPNDAQATVGELYFNGTEGVNGGALRATTNSMTKIYRWE